MKTQRITTEIAQAAEAIRAAGWDDTSAPVLTMTFPGDRTITVTATEIGFDATPDAAAETAHFLVPDREPGQIILILCQLDLKLAFTRFGALGEDIKNERTAVEHGRF